MCYDMASVSDVCGGSLCDKPKECLCRGQSSKRFSIQICSVKNKVTCKFNAYSTHEK